MVNKEQFRKKVQEDTAFSASLKEAKTPEEVQKALLAAGFQVPMEDVLAMVKPDAVELSDEQLEAASGGWDDSDEEEWLKWLIEYYRDIAD